MKKAKPQAISPSRGPRRSHYVVHRLRARPGIRPRVEWIEARTLLSTFIVLNTADTGDGSLRQAILDSDAAVGQANTIEFDIPGDGVQKITPQTMLPAVTSGVLIDGWSQPGFTGRR